MHKARQNMAAESKLPVVESLNMARELWRLCLKTVDVGDCEQVQSCLFATMLGWLGQPKFERLMASLAPSELCVSYLIFSFSKYLLRFIASIFTKCPRFQYQEEKVNEWFTLPSEGAEKYQAPNIMNVDKDGQERKCYSKENQAENGFSKSLEEGGFELFFHGTSHESAKDIMESGIDVEVKVVKKARDFSHAGDGFYLGKSFDKAWEWARKRHLNSSPAVLVFRVNKTELRGKNNDNEDGLVSLDLRGPEKITEWKEVISQFRSGKPDLTFLKRHRKFQFIEGPMASIPGKKSRSVNFEWLQYPKQIDGSYQLCVKEDNCAELFYRSLHSVVFFDK